ncbi:MAG: hypothetical protein HDS52_03550 [Barnesiella sp.]|nr:hypothetical protein [Barnesiella sp.]
MSFFQSTEFYVILFLVAGAIVALLAKPNNTAEAREYLIASSLSSSVSTASSSAATGSHAASNTSDNEPSIAVYCDESGGVWLRRTGLEGLDDSAAVSAKVVVKGFNITVYERITEGKYGLVPVDTALFSLDFLTAARYWLRYESESTNRSATLSFNNIPGYRAHSPLKQ